MNTYQRNRIGRGARAERARLAQRKHLSRRQRNDAVRGWIVSALMDAEDGCTLYPVGAAS